MKEKLKKLFAITDLIRRCFTVICFFAILGAAVTLIPLIVRYIRMKWFILA